MEYRYIDIEAHIRTAQKLRSEALADILGTAWKKCVSAIKRLASRRLHAHIVATRASDPAIY